MSEQRTFAGLAWTAKTKATRRERFLADMNDERRDSLGRIRGRHRALLPEAPPASERAPPMAIETMLRIYFLPQWFDPSDPAAEDALYDSEAMRRFVGVELDEDAIPDETTILRFRHLLEQRRLTEQLFAVVRARLEAQGLLLTAGTIVDATILQAPSSTKNATGTRDPEMWQAKKGKIWHFGMKGARGDGSPRRGPLAHDDPCGGGRHQPTAGLAARGGARALWGSDLLVGIRSRARGGGRPALPGQPPPDETTAPLRPLAADQSGTRANALPGARAASTRFMW